MRNIFLMLISHEHEKINMFLFLFLLFYCKFIRVHFKWTIILIVIKQNDLYAMCFSDSFDLIWSLPCNHSTNTSNFVQFFCPDTYLSSSQHIILFYYIHIHSQCHHRQLCRTHYYRIVRLGSFKLVFALSRVATPLFLLTVYSKWFLCSCLNPCIIRPHISHCKIDQIDKSHCICHLQSNIKHDQ